MSKTAVCLALAIVVAGLVGVRAAQPVPRAFVCSFDTGTEATVDQGTVEAKPITGAPLNVTFAAVDPAKGTAQIVGNLGASDITLIVGTDGYSFVEVTGVGNVILTTVFDTSVASGGLFAVMSRHVSIQGPVVSHYRGACEPRF
jgi:hypothetical protein